MTRFTRVSLGIVVGLITVFASAPLPATASASPGGGVIAVNPSSYNFGGVAEQVQEVTTVIEVRNTGPSNLVVNELSLAGQNSEDFHYFAQWPFTVAPGAGRQILVSFTPSSIGPKAAVFQIKSGAENQSEVDVSLTGNGLSLGVLGHVSARAVPSNVSPRPGDLITVDVRVDMRGANPPANLLQNYEAKLTWDPSMLTYSGLTWGDQPWIAPASTSQANDSITWFDSVSSGSGGTFSILRLRFRVIGETGSNITLNLQFLRMEGDGVENLLPILITSAGNVNIGARATPPEITVTPASCAFGDVPVGSIANKTIVVSNKGSQNLTVSSTTLGGWNANQFSIVSGRAPFVLSPGGSREVVIGFKPTQKGTKNATLLILSNDPDDPSFTVSLAGAVTAPNIEVTPASLDFGNVAVGALASKTLVVRNRGTSSLFLLLFGLDGGQLQFSYNTGNLILLMPGQSRNITVNFHPSSEGAKTADFVISSNDPSKITVEIPLSGIGIRRP